VRYQLNLKRQRRTLQQQAQHYQRQNLELRTAQTLLGEVLNSLVDGIGAFRAVRDDRGQIVDFTQQVTNAAFNQLIHRRT
jgi:two-component system cell cycle response regulator